MKTTFLRITFWMAAFVCFSSLTVSAQSSSSSGSARSDSDQTLREILNEVRQLRADLQRLNVNAHRTQALLDRMKVQQEQLVRLTREIGNVRDELSGVRGRQVRVKDALEMLEKKRDVGLVREEEVKVVGAELEELKQREQFLTEREPVLVTELDSTRATLAQLNARLDELEQEIATPPASQGQTKKN